MSSSRGFRRVPYKTRRAPKIHLPVCWPDTFARIHFRSGHDSRASSPLLSRELEQLICGRCAASCEATHVSLMQLPGFPDPQTGSCLLGARSVGECIAVAETCQALLCIRAKFFSYFVQQLEWIDRPMLIRCQTPYFNKMLMRCQAVQSSSPAPIQQNVEKRGLAPIQHLRADHLKANFFEARCEQMDDQQRR